MALWWFQNNNLMKIGGALNVMAGRWIRTTAILAIFLTLTMFIILSFKELKEALIALVSFDRESIYVLGLDGSLLERSWMLANSFSMISDNFITGIGLNNWKIDFPAYQFGGTAWLNDGKLKITRPHNDFVLYFAESGIFCFLSYCAIFAAGLKTAWNNLKGQSRDAVLAITCFSFLAAYMVIAFFYFPGERVYPAVLLCTILAFTINGTPEHENGNQQHRYYLKILIGIAITFLILSGYWNQRRLLEERKLFSAYYARFSQDWYSLASYSSSINQNYLAIDPLTTPVSWYTATAYINLGNL